MAAISHGADWDFDLLERYDAEIAKVAAEFGLDTYPNQLEIITSEQMLDAYASSGLPIGYPHWSYGKEFIRNEQAYRRGMQGLAYEIVINSSPCIAYLMEENTMTTQALVIAHACYGHNSFFKGNHLFRQWTDAEAILDYLVFARRYVMECEERHGAAAVEEVIDACHALMAHGVDRYRRPPALTLKAETARLAAREAHRERQFNDLWRTLPEKAATEQGKGRRTFPVEPQENILYFVEKFSPKLEPWQRELVRIVRKLAQYFHPQGQTKVMNEGWATFWHYTILNRMHERGLVDDGFMLEFLKSHTNVIAQPAYASKINSGLNPYALGTRGPRVVPGHRRERLAEDARFRDAELQGRVVRRPVPVAAADARIPPVRDRRPRGGRRARRRLDPRRARLQARAEAAVAPACAGDARAGRAGRALRPRRRPLANAAPSAPPRPAADRRSCRGARAHAQALGLHGAPRNVGRRRAGRERRRMRGVISPS